MVIQNGWALNAAILTAMGVRSYQGEMALMVPNAVALTELVQIWEPRNVGTQNDLARNAVIQSAPALHFVAGFRLARVVHFFAVAIQKLGLVIHSAAQVAPAQFAHDAQVSRSPRSLYWDRRVTDDLSPLRVPPSSQKIFAPAFHLMNESELQRQRDPTVGAAHALDELRHQLVVDQSRCWGYLYSQLASRVSPLVR